VEEDRVGSRGRQWTLMLELAYDGQRLEGMEVDCFGSCGPQWTIVFLDDDGDVLCLGVTFMVCCKEWGSLETLQCICATN
jgi:hypothetical protein